MSEWRFSFKRRCNVRKSILSFLLLSGATAHFTLGKDIKFFVHPGITNTQQELDLIKQTVNNNPDHPMTIYYNKMKNWDGARHEYQHKALGIVLIKGGGVIEEELRFRKDAQAAYACALQWAITGDDRYMEKSKRILNDWARTFVGLEPIEGSKEAAQLAVEAGWATPIWVAAAEIIRHYNKGSAKWSASEITQFSRFLDKLWDYFGSLYDGSLSKRIQRRNNWGTSAALSMISVAVFQDDTKRYQDAVAYWKELLPLTVEKNGELFETCRDCHHPGYALNTLIQAAEIARHQGESLYDTIIDGQAKPRLWYGLEYRARRVLGRGDPEAQFFGRYRNYQPDCASCDLCWYESGWEIGVNYYENLMRIECKNAKELVMKARRRKFGFDEHFVAFGTLTHGGFLKGE
jgi:hypothetical protein